MSSIHSPLSQRPANPDSRFYTAVMACLVAVLCYLAAELGWMLVIRPQMLWPIWPACAFLVAVLLLLPRRIWPILLAAGLAGFVLSDLQAGLTLRSTALLILADTVEVLIAIVGVSYAFDGLPHLNSVKSLARYSFFAVFLAPLAAVFIVTAALDGNYWIRWRVGFFTEALALLTLTPAILSVASTVRTWTRKSSAFYFEAATLIAALSCLGYAAFMAPAHSGPQVPLYAFLPFLLWAALRFGFVGISTSIVVVAFLSIWGAVHGRGPFTESEPVTNVMSLQLFLFFAATTFMVLAALVEEQKEGDRAFRESERRFRLVADTAPVLIWMADADKLCTYFNKPWLDFTGRSIDLELGNGWAEGVHPQDLPRCMDTYAQAFDRREEFRMEYRLRRHDGEYRWVFDVGVPRLKQDRSFVGYIGCCVDVSERKHAEEVLRDSEERFHLAAEAGKMFAYEWDAATDLVVRSPEAGPILGIEDAARTTRTTGQQASADVHPDDQERLFAALAALSPENPNLHVSYRMVRHDGKVIWLDRTSLAHFDEQGKMLRIVGMATDVTQRKLEEQELALANDRLRLAMESGRSVGWEWDLKSGRDSWFGDLKSMFGVPSETFVGRTEDFYRYVHAEDRPLVAKAVAEARESRNPYAADFRVVWADGTVRWVSSRGKFYYSPEGKPERMLGMAVDITEQRRTEASLRMFRELIDESSDAIEVVDPDTLRFLDVNERACRDLGYTRDELLSLRVYDIDPLVDESSALEHRKEFDATGSLRFDAIHRRKDGSTYPVEVNLKRVQLDRVYCVNVVRDITERKRSDEALRQKDADLTEAQRIAEVGSWQWEPESDTVIWSRELYRIAGRDYSLPAVSFAEHSSLYTPESWKRLREAVEEAMRSATPYQLDLQMIRSDGAMRWIKARGEAQLDTTGRVIRLRGTVQDITERKRVEAVLSGMNRKLIEAQEQERARIARDLHDDLGQRIALLANEMEQLRQSHPDLPIEVSGGIRGLQEQVFQIATDVQSLSHKLHSSKLEYLGIAPAMRGFCQEFGGQQKVKIDFKSQDLPSPLSPDISLCLFRVLQEALSNAVKHSGVRHVDVQLLGRLDEVHLTVRDSGAGFDSEAVKQSRGLGLISMEERVKLLNGTLSIESKPNRGTTIHARVPLSSESDSLRAAG